MHKLSTAESQPAPSHRAARLSIGATVAFVGLLLVLHIIKPGIDPSWRFISEYAIGDHGWILSLAFFALATSCAALAAAIRPDLRTISGRIGMAGLLAMALGLIIAAVFTTDPITTPPEAMTTTGKLHAFGGALGMGMPVAIVLITWNLARHPRWSAARVPLIVTGVLAVAGTIAFIGALATLVPPDGRFGPDVPVGWPNRLEVLTTTLWLMTVAWHVAQGLAVPNTSQRPDNTPAAAA